LHTNRQTDHSALRLHSIHCTRLHHRCSGHICYRHPLWIVGQLPAIWEDSVAKRERQREWAYRVGHTTSNL